MGTEVRVLAAAGMALVVSLTGTALFSVAGRLLEQEEAGTVRADCKRWDNSMMRAVCKRWQNSVMRADSGKLWQAGMYAGNVLAAVVLTAVYAAGMYSVIQMLFLCTVLWVCAWTDCRAYLIFNRILLFGLLVYLALFALQGILAPGQMRDTAIGAGISAAGLFAAGFLCRIVMPGSVGAGDLKLMIVLGLYLGMEHTWNAVFYTLLSAFFVSVWLLATKRASGKSVLPFAPFLLIGTLAALFLHGI